mgnify:FL=1
MTQGTNQREKIYIYGTCSSCSDANVLVYNINEQLLCANDARTIAQNTRYTQSCDRCGAAQSFRDPRHRRNEYLCISCHEQDGYVSRTNVVHQAVRAMLRTSLPIGVRSVCEAANYGTECDANIKPRNSFGGRLLCNTHSRPIAKKAKKDKKR